MLADGTFLSVDLYLPQDYPEATSIVKGQSPIRVRKIHLEHHEKLLRCGVCLCQPQQRGHGYFFSFNLAFSCGGNRSRRNPQLSES